PETVARLVERLENIIQFESEMWVLHSLFRSSNVNQQTVITDIMQNGLSLLSSNNQQISPVRYARNSIFISYRRADSADIVGRMYDRLSAYFGKETIFRDVQTINAGEDFQQRILSAVNECHVMLAIIGTEWMNVLDKETDQPRLHDPDDYVRREIAAALKRTDSVVVPVLVRGARMPDDQDLPDDLKELHFRNALQVRTDPDFEEDLKRLMNAIEITVRVP
ncbi:MAG: toll/interleukin-1 receptor domain-containing protein, partial [Burkholderiales bacterium]|nr:toll/interleukin-1 receptor domain-containing protein [Anaerolineae bacterium]